MAPPLSTAIQEYLAWLEIDRHRSERTKPAGQRPSTAFQAGHSSHSPNVQPGEHADRERPGQPRTGHIRAADRGT